MLVRISEAESSKDLKGLAPVDYRIAGSRSVRDEAERHRDNLKSLRRELREKLPVEPEVSVRPDSTGYARANWVEPLFEALGFGHLDQVGEGGIVASDGSKTFPVSHRRDNTLVHVTAWNAKLDTRPGAGLPAPQSLLQEALNRTDEHSSSVVQSIALPGNRVPIRTSRVTPAVRHSTRIAYPWDSALPTPRRRTSGDRGPGRQTLGGRGGHSPYHCRRGPCRRNEQTPPSSSATDPASLYYLLRSPARTSTSKQRPSPEPLGRRALFCCRSPYRATRSLTVSDNPFHTHLPRNPKEFAAFMLVIAVISVNTIPVAIGGLTAGFTVDMWTDLLRVMPLLLVAVVAVVLLTMKPAQVLTARLVRPGDSFRAHMILHALCSVLLISLVMTVVGTWIGTRQVSTEPLDQFAHLWPRNCTIAFLVEALLAQPVARQVMRRHHRRVDARAALAAA